MVRNFEPGKVYWYEEPEGVLDDLVVVLMVISRDSFIVLNDSGVVRETWLDPEYRIEVE